MRTEEEIRELIRQVNEQIIKYCEYDTEFTIAAESYKSALKWVIGDES